MAQLFPQWANKFPTIFAISVVGGLTLTVLLIWYYWSPKALDVGYRPKQPVPYSHKLHAGDLGIDCRYCHTTVEKAANASVPPTQTCMNCHEKHVLPQSEKLLLVRESWTTGKPIEWIKVHKVPDYAYDQAFVSASMLDEKSFYVFANSLERFSAPYLFQPSRRSDPVGQLFSTFYNERYIGGYSHHLPISVVVYFR